MESTVTETPVSTQAPVPASNPWAKKSPWGKSPPVVPCSLEEVMSEQLAAKLQGEEEGWEQLQTKSDEKKQEQRLEGAVAAAQTEEEITEILAAAGVGTDEYGTSDEMIARLMQLEFDKEHNRMLEKEQDKYNGTNKVQISFDNYKTSHPVYEAGDEEDDDDGDYDPVEANNWDKSPPTIGSKGYTKTGKGITTKHDKAICGRRNAEKMMMFPPGFCPGDGEGMDMKLPNHVYNKLKAHSQKENKHSQKLHEKKEHSTAEHAVDSRTRLLLYKIVNNGVLDSISGTISGGKESVVFHAYGGHIEGEDLPKECAIKVFKTTLNEFKNREQYIHGDVRFFRNDFKKQNPRKIVKQWAHKEAYNLNRMKKFDIPCPRVVLQKQHILVMSFIGEDGRSAPKLKNVNFSTEALEDAYEQTRKTMGRLYKECGLVHADLSEFNMLWHQDTVYFIDVSQSVDLMHHKAMEFLFRDCTNVCTFFQKQGAHDVLTPEALFNEVTDLDIPGTGVDFLTHVRRYDKERKEAMVMHSNQYREYAFDFHFESSQKQRASALDKMGLEDSDDDDDEEND